MPTTRLFNRIFCKNSHRSLQNPYHTCRFAPYVLFVVHRVANLRRSIRIYQTLGFNVLKGSSLRRAFSLGVGYN